MKKNKNQQHCIPNSIVHFFFIYIYLLSYKYSLSFNQHLNKPSFDSYTAKNVESLKLGILEECMFPKAYISIHASFSIIEIVTCP